MYGAQQRLLQKVEGDEGVLENLFSVWCEQEWEERAEEELQRLSSSKRQRNQGQQETFSTSAKGQR